MKRLRSALAFAFVLTVSSAAADNLLSNPEFDTDLSGWDSFASWSTEDWESSLSSGSATMTNSIPSTSSVTVVKQCLTPATLANGYHLAGYILNPSGQSGEGYGKLTLSFFSAADCDDPSFIIGYDTASVQQTGTWEQVELTQATPAEAVSMKVYVFLQKIGEPGAVQLFTDHLLLEPQAAIFLDGFELGSTAEWSESEPPPAP